MAKDPAFLFYYQDFLVGTDEYSNEEVGAYIRCLCIQAAKGGISEKHMKNICITQEVHNLIKSKFVFYENEKFFRNDRLLEEMERRKNYSKSRATNRLGKKKVVNTSTSYVPHMEAENETKSINGFEEKKEAVIIPIEEIGSEKVSIAANLVWKDGKWKENFCMGNNVTMEELPLWMAKFNASVCNDKIPDFGPSKYKKMLQGWVVAQKAKGTKVEPGSTVKKSDAAPLKYLQSNGV